MAMHTLHSLEYMCVRTLKGEEQGKSLANEIRSLRSRTYFPDAHAVQSGLAGPDLCPGP